jgi:class 3 adenylate cyclase
VSSPPTHYARSGDASIAYQVVGEGPCDLVTITGPASHLELMWEEPRTARTFTRMAEFARLIMFDQLMEMTANTSLRAVLPTIRVPTLVLHTTGNLVVPVQCGREVASLIPGARFIEYEGSDAYGWIDPPGMAEIEEFLTGRRSMPRIDRVLATVLFTDIVGSTERLSKLGDAGWRARLEDHNRVVRAGLRHWRGREIKTSGDGFLATFDGPARAVSCAAEIVDGVASLGLSVRAGIHTGECELREDDVAGIAVHIAARVMHEAGPGEVLASSTVKDLVVGSGLRFADRGLYSLRGVQDDWHLFAVQH